MFCHFCGTQLRQTARFCRNCGARVDEYEDDKAPSQKLSAAPQEEEEVFYPWWQNVNAIILPSRRELLEEEVNNVEADSRAQIVPIKNSPIPTLVELPTPIERPNGPNGVASARNESVSSSPMESQPQKRPLAVETDSRSPWSTPTTEVKNESGSPWPRQTMEVKNESQPQWSPPTTEVRNESGPPWPRRTMEVKNESQPPWPPPVAEPRQESRPQMMPVIIEPKQVPRPQMPPPTTDLKQLPRPQMPPPTTDLKQLPRPQMPPPTTDLKQVPRPQMPPPMAEPNQVSRSQTSPQMAEMMVEMMAEPKRIPRPPMPPPIAAPRQVSQPLEPFLTVETEPERRRKRSTLGVPLLILAVILLFALAFIWLK